MLQQEVTETESMAAGTAVHAALEAEVTKVSLPVASFTLTTGNFISMTSHHTPMLLGC